ncbi:AAA family ATPase [Marinilactibacillus kalidii]|uniref:AAA family ATPase n=1 Tax=Marinilactibacillus kalidii TaxID=2820274 RepID=UPI001ABE87B6|nr:AAA family ATPase [Marinilactibacillus kalidii]
MKKYLILLAGSPATGKSYLVEELKTVLPDMFIITPDEGKEIIADSVGFSNLAEKAVLEKEVWDFYYGVLAYYMKIGKKVILSEYPFSQKQKGELSKLSTQHEYTVITIRLVADFEILWERRKKRDVELSRHLSHIQTHYHYGDSLEDRSTADNLITKEGFKQMIETRGYNDFQLGELIEIDVTDYTVVDYSGLKQTLQYKITHDL